MDRQLALQRSMKDASLLTEFVEVWCEGHHGERGRRPWQPGGILGGLVDERAPELCEECIRELSYSLGRRLLCPYDPKPACKHCETPCYREDNRLRMREIMRYAGWRLILRGRFDLLWKYFF